MRRLFPLVFLLLAASAFAQKVETVFADGKVERKDAKGLRLALEIGDRLGPGEEVITGKNGKADLKLLAGSAILNVRPNSVLLLGEKSVAGEQRTVLQTVAGSVAMKFNSLGGKEPLVGTSACIAAIRGTEVEVYAGMDGSSLLAVVSGAVSLESDGSTVDLAANEAVEVKAGQGPGKKFTWLGREVNFSDWNKGKLDAFLGDPQTAVLDVEAQLSRYKNDMNALLPQLAEQSALYDAAYAELKKLVDAKDDKGAEELRQTRFFPIMQARGTLILDIRYYALSALSLRRFALGSMYAQMKSRHFLDGETGSYGDFLAVYHRILADFESTFVPQLVERDI